MRALVVDDSASARQMSVVALEDAAASLGQDVEIETAESGVVALRALTTTTFDVLLVDLHMPDMTGLEVLRFWRGQGNDGPRLALVVSSEVSPRDREKVQAAGARDFVEKPVSSQALVPHLKALLGERA